MNFSINRCRYQEQGAQANSIVNFECPDPGLVGNTVTLQNLVSNLEVLEVEVLGKIQFLGKSLLKSFYKSLVENRYSYSRFKSVVFNLWTKIH